MRSIDSNDEKMEKDILEFAKFYDDPAAWGEKAWNDSRIDPMALWQWAESQNRIEFMSQIANGVAIQILKTNFGLNKDDKRQNWISDFEHLAADAYLKGQLESYARFQEALLKLNHLGYRDVEKIDKILALYEQLGKLEKTAYYLYVKSTTLNGFLVRGELKSSESEIWELLIEAYHISKKVMFYKGITLAFIGLGDYSTHKNNDKLALKFFYQAHFYAKIARTKFGITAIDSLRQIRDRSNILASEYEIEINPDILIDEFLKEVSG
jgi:hypothetical protein